MNEQHICTVECRPILSLPCILSVSTGETHTSDPHPSDCTMCWQDFATDTRTDHAYAAPFIPPVTEAPDSPEAWHAMVTGRGRALVCGDCWYVLRPGDYLPDGGEEGTCSMCGADSYQVNRVAWAEIDAARAEDARTDDAQTGTQDRRGA